MSARFPLIASLVSFGALCAAPAAQAQYTVKVGGAYIVPHATSESLQGGVAVPSPLGGHLVLNSGVSFEVQPGEIFGVIGPNGSGKTTLFNSMLGQITPDSGRIELNGQDVSGMGPLALNRLGVGRTFQTLQVFGKMTVRDNLAFGLRNIKLAESEIDRRIQEAARMLELDALLARDVVADAGQSSGTLRGNHAWQ